MSDHVIASQDVIVRDEALHTDRKIFAGQQVPPELVEAYRAAGGDSTADPKVAADAKKATADLAKREKAVADAEAKLETRETAVKNAEAELTGKTTAVEAREKAVADAEAKAKGAQKA